METDLVINSDITIPESELIFSVSKSSGPGGQHVNKTSSKVTLRWNVLNSVALSEGDKEKILHHLKSRIVGEKEILLQVESERSQLRNKNIARKRLADLVRNALEPTKPRVATKPTLGSKLKRIKNKKKRGFIKELRKTKFSDPLF